MLIIPPTDSASGGSERGEDGPHEVRVRRLGVDTHDEPIVFMRRDSEVCRSEGFGALARVHLELDERTVIAALNVVEEGFLEADVAGLSDRAWRLLGEPHLEVAKVRHPEPLESFRHVRGKVYGDPMGPEAMHDVIQDIVRGRYSGTHISAFLTACAGGRTSLDESVYLTRAMIDAGSTLSWDRDVVADKHSVGGLPGNRTTPIVVAIATSFGLTMPKTSSRAITSPAGTADTMAVLTDVDLDIPTMRRVVDEVGGCLTWGGAVNLSPADDILIRVERVLDIDSEAQLIASVLSKKKAAGSTHVILEMPVGPTAKVRTEGAAQDLANRLGIVAERIGLETRVLQTNGHEPVGRGIGPALEARDVLAVLRREDDAPGDLARKSVVVAGELLELVGAVDPGAGREAARACLGNGDAWRQFQRICEAQGGLRSPPTAHRTRGVRAGRSGTVTAIDNRRLSRVAKLAGAPEDPAAGVLLHTPLGTEVDEGDPLFTVHAESPGELNYALDYVRGQTEIITVQPDP